LNLKLFEDDYPNLMIEKCHLLRARDCVIFLDFLNTKSIFEQLALLYALPRYFCRSLVVVLPYFPSGSRIREDKEGRIITATTLARLLSITPLTQMGPARLIIFDIHDLQERFYFDQNIIPILFKSSPIILSELRSNFSELPVSIVFPDEGAYKRYSKDFEEFPIISCTKIVLGKKSNREEKSRRRDSKTILSQGQAKDRFCVIVDDFVLTGTTLIDCKNALLAAGATAVSCFVTHALFPDDSWKQFTTEDEKTRFKHFMLTDSCPTVVQKLQNEPLFRVLSIAPSIFKYITHNKI